MTTNPVFDLAPTPGGLSGSVVAMPFAIGAGAARAASRRTLLTPNIHSVNFPLGEVRAPAPAAPIARLRTGTLQRRAGSSMRTASAGTGPRRRGRVPGQHARRPSPSYVVGPHRNDEQRPRPRPRARRNERRHHLRSHAARRCHLQAPSPTGVGSSTPAKVRTCSGTSRTRTFTRRRTSAAVKSARSSLPPCP